MKRKAFIQQSTLLAGGLLVSPHIIHTKNKMTLNKLIPTNLPYVISTWNVPLATKIAGDALEKGIEALDAAVLGVAYQEANLQNTTV